MEIAIPGDSYLKVGKRKTTKILKQKEFIKHIKWSDVPVELLKCQRLARKLCGIQEFPGQGILES